MKTFLRKCLVLIAMLAPLCGVSAQETTVELVAGTDKPVNSSATTLAKDGITLSWVTGGGSNPAKFYDYAQYRIYSKNEVTFTSEANTVITKIEFTIGSGYKSSDFSVKDNNGTYDSNTGIWTGSSSSVTIKAAAQVRVTKITITLESEGPTKTPTTLTFDEESFEFYQGDMGGVISNNLATLSPAIDGAVITYETNNTDIVTNIDNGVVTYSTEKTGIATITAQYAGNETYKASEAKYTITIKKAVISGAENYVKIDSNDDLTGKYVVISSVESTKKDFIMTKLNSTTGTSYYTCAEVALNESKNQISKIPDGVEGFPVLSFTYDEGNKNYAVCNTTTGKEISCSGSTAAGFSEVTIGTGTHATIAFDDETGKIPTITFACTGDNKILKYNGANTRFAAYKTNSGGVTAIQLFRHGYSRDVTNGNFGTLCLPYGGTISGATLYTIEGKQMENGEVKSISLVEVDKVEAGKPYIFQATAEKLVVYYEGSIRATADNDNGLLGSYNGTTVEAGKYVISNNTVKKCGANSKIGKNRCYIDMDNVPEKTASAAALIISFNDSTDAIESIEANADSRNAIYDLSGRRVKTAQKGLYIVNGKKIIK